MVGNFSSKQVFVWNNKKLVILLISFNLFYTQYTFATGDGEI